MARSLFALTGKFIVAEGGRVGRVGGARDRNLPEVAQIGEFDAVAFDASSKRLFVSTRYRQLKIFSVPDFEVQRALNVGTQISAMAVDTQGGKLYAVITDRIDRNPRGVTTAGDLAVFDISNLLSK